MAPETQNQDYERMQKELAQAQKDTASAMDTMMTMRAAMNASMAVLVKRLDELQKQRQLVVSNDGDQMSTNKLTKLDFPRFNGDDVDSWLSKCDHFFMIDGTLEWSKVRNAALRMDGRALKWHLAYMKSSGKAMEEILWTDYSRCISDRFSTTLMKETMYAMEVESSDYENTSDLGGINSENDFSPSLCGNVSNSVGFVDKNDVNSEKEISVYKVFDEIPERIFDEVRTEIEDQCSDLYLCRTILSGKPEPKIVIQDVNMYEKDTTRTVNVDVIMDDSCDLTFWHFNGETVGLNPDVLVKVSRHVVMAIESSGDIVCFGDFWGQKSLKMGVLDITSFGWKPGWLYSITNIENVTLLKDGMNLFSYEFLACQGNSRRIGSLSMVREIESFGWKPGWITRIVTREVLLEMVDAHKSGLIISSSEDGLAKIWKDRVCVQSIVHLSCEDMCLVNGFVVNINVAVVSSGVVQDVKGCVRNKRSFGDIADDEDDTIGSKNVNIKMKENPSVATYQSYLEAARSEVQKWYSVFHTEEAATESDLDAFNLHSPGKLKLKPELKWKMGCFELKSKHPDVVVPSIIHQEHVIIPLNKVGCFIGPNGSNLVKLEMETCRWMLIDTIVFNTVAQNCSELDRIVKKRRQRIRVEESAQMEKYAKANIEDLQNDRGGIVEEEIIEEEDIFISNLSSISL